MSLSQFSGFPNRDKAWLVFWSWSISSVIVWVIRRVKSEQYHCYGVTEGQFSFCKYYYREFYKASLLMKYSALIGFYSLIGAKI